MRSRSGFTLLEMTVTLAVAGLVFVVAGQALRFAARAAARQDTLRAESRSLTMGWAEARRALNAIDPGSRDRPALFRAGPGRLAFTMAGQGNGPIEAAMFVDNAHRLVLYWTGQGATGERVLAAGVASAAFGFRPAAGSGAWRSTWRGPGPPTLIRLSVVWDDPAARPWPPLIAGPAFVEPDQ